MVARSPKMFQLEVLHEEALQGSDDDKSHDKLRTFAIDENFTDF